MSEFFDQLWEFSRRYAARAGLDTNHSPWGYDSYRDDRPTGVVFHYTADGDFHRVLRWFVRPKYGAKVSSEVVVAKRRMPYHDEAADGLPLMEQLPATVFQCRRLGEASWHAKLVNRTHFGIELVNHGELPESDRSIAVALDGGLWEPYRAGQLEAANAVVYALQSHYGSIDPTEVLGHEQVQWGKRDPGPHFPLHQLRLVARAHPTGTTRPWEVFTAQKALDKRDYEVRSWSARETGMTGEPWADFRRLVGFWRGGDWVAGDWSLVKLSLQLLGYSSDNVYRSVRAFQRMAKIAMDGDPGPITKRFLVDRLTDRGILDS